MELGETRMYIFTIVLVELRLGYLRLSYNIYNITSLLRTLKIFSRVVERHLELIRDSVKERDRFFDDDLNRLFFFFFFLCDAIDVHWVFFIYAYYNIYRFCITSAGTFCVLE